MIHPIFMTALRRPELLFNHFANYAELVKAEVASIGTSLAIRAACAALAVVALMLALGLTGVAVMMGFLSGAFHWVLVIVPGVAWLLTLIAATVAMRSTMKRKVDDMKDEVDADLKMMRLIQEAKND